MTTADAILRDLIKAMPAPRTRKLTGPWSRALDYVHSQPAATPADPVKEELIAALKRLAGAFRDRQRLHGEDIGYVLMPLKDAEEIIARAEGRA